MGRFNVFQRVSGEEGIAVEQAEVERPRSRRDDGGPAANGAVIAQLAVMEELISPGMIGGGRLARYLPSTCKGEREDD